ncbi:uncharacterized protein LOC128737347 isoform X2 [Sabethes cyaneus]|uniref:uncharacterized protein LOC128737347 isoform X2 n=1 Tax=Sabethes cyaneus TaxID=53552 RepID=UPI00237E5F45|nr:uncharacterized protein LOC128737347 isoform X2 [Sabethes cyaneus]XP_053687944.1 uncharacterized protein LOC128737347 isoform X2 [Sabethes cyaneus]
MFTVVQFIYKQELHVLTVPLSWISGDSLMLPESLDDFVERLRVQGNPYNGPTKMVPAIVGEQYETFGEAVNAASSLDPIVRNITNSILMDQNHDQESHIDMLIDMPSDPQAVQHASLKLEADESIFSYDSESTPEVDTNNRSIEQSDGLTRAELRKELSYLKEDLRIMIQTAVRTAVEECFQADRDRFAAPMWRPVKAYKRPLQLDMPVETRKPIETEEQLAQWNVELADEFLCEKYYKYFSKIVTPNSCVGDGDNACYTIVDCLFTRSFWNLFTWTGINRGQKSQRGFREFGNVTQLLVNIVCIGDPTYTSHKLENFCKTRLFRHSKSRALAKKMRRSACRPGRMRAVEQGKADSE